MIVGFGIAKAQMGFWICFSFDTIFGFCLDSLKAQVGFRRIKILMMMIIIIIII
jgi:hypothetical protein